MQQCTCWPKSGPRCGNGFVWVFSVAYIDLASSTFKLPTTIHLQAISHHFHHLPPCQVGSGGGFPETLRDLHLALQWLRTPPAAELLGAPAPLALLGHSAGGHLATWLGLQQGLEKPMFSGEVPGGSWTS